MADDRVDRKLVAILAADVAGYTRLMGADEEATLAALNAHRTELIDPAIGGHGGRIVKTTGDGLLAEFASVVDAVRAALAIQEGMAARNEDVAEDRRMRFRIGVNLGDVIVQDDDIYGDGVNVAARLEALAEPGGICVSASVHEQVRRRVAVRFEDRGRIEVRNVADPVHVFRVAGPGAAGARSRRVPRRRAAIAASVVLLAAGAGAYAFWALRPAAPPPVTTADLAATAPAPPRAQSAAKLPAIAVLPFENLSEDAGQDYFSLGMTEDLITDLDKIAGLIVMSRSATLRYRGGKIDVREVGRALGVRYVVAGSVRRSGDLLRINARLSDATNGAQLWAERYDGTAKDIFGLQDRVLARIVDSLAITLSSNERRRLAAHGTENVTAHDLYLRGLHKESTFTRRGYGEAVALYEQALAIDPDYPRPYTRLANILELSARNGWSRDLKADLEKAVALAEKAVALDPNDPRNYWSLGRASARLRKPGSIDRGIWAMRRAIALDANFADAYAFLGVLYMSAGRAADGLKSVETAMRLNSRFPFWYLHMRGMAHYLLKDYAAAITDLSRAAQRSPNAQFVRWWLAAAFAQAGHQEDAEWQVEEVRALGFTGSLTTIIEAQPIQHPAYVAHMRAGMLKAGLPE